jgi:hypothetical protein
MNLLQESEADYDCLHEALYDSHRYHGTNVSADASADISVDCKHALAANGDSSYTQHLTIIMISVQ